MGWESNAIFQVLIVTGSTGSGVFVYSPSPGAGNLIASVAAVAGTDPYGNAYLAGVANYTNLGGGSMLAVQLVGGAFSLLQASVIGGPYTLEGVLQMLAFGSSDIELASNTGNVLIQAPGAGKVIALQRASTVSDGVAGGNVLDVTNTTAGGAAPISRVTAAAIGDLFLGARVSGDTSSRVVLDTVAVTGVPRLRFGPGNSAPDMNLQRAAAGVMAVLGADFAVDQVGKGLQVKEGANAKQGTAVLAAGTVTVANTSVTINSRIMLSAQDNATTGALRISARVLGTSFTITSSNAADSGAVAYQIFEPAP